jgi:hypothetical protein
VQAKQICFAEMMCKHLIFCVKAATRLAVYLVEEATNTNFIVLGMNRLGIEPQIYHTQG